MRERLFDLSILGHRSDDLRAYKKTSSEQEVQVSDILLCELRLEKNNEQERGETIDVWE